MKVDEQMAHREWAALSRPEILAQFFRLICGCVRENLAAPPSYRLPRRNTSTDRQIIIIINGYSQIWLLTCPYQANMSNFKSLSWTQPTGRSEKDPK